MGTCSNTACPFCKLGRKVEVLGSFMEIRKAKDIDLQRIEDLLYQVCRVHHEGRPDLFRAGKKYSKSEVSEIIRNEKTPVFVALDTDGVVQGYAFCIFKQELNSGALTDIKSLYIDDLCVEETKRGMHIGQELYEYVLRFAKEQGCYNVTLNVWSCNPNAMAFYEKCGLVPQKIGMEKIL